MTAIELNAKKMEIIEMLVGIDNEKALAKILSLVCKSAKDNFERIPGLAYTKEERIAEIDQAMKDYHAGLFVSHEEVFKPYKP